MTTLPNESPDSAAEDVNPADDVLPVRLAGREAFVPFRKAELAAALAGRPELDEAKRALFRRFCRLLDVLLHSEYHATLEQLKNAYAPFDPDNDTQAVDDAANAGADALRHTLFERFGWLLERANFIRLAKEDIHTAVTDRSHWGLSLDLNFEIFERLEVYCRGDVIGTRFRRTLRNRFRTEAVEVPIYQRLAVIFRIQPDRTTSKYLDTQDVYVKLFKDIPKADLDMLLPGTRVKMSLLDRAKILVPSLGGITVGVVKLFLVALNPYLILGVVGGTLGYSARSIYGYLNTRQKYQLNLTQSLYFQNLDNNSGAIHRLLDEAEEQENREAMLAYYFLWQAADKRGTAPEELDRRIEAFVAERVDGEIDFEIGDALAKLARLEVVRRDDEGRWHALPIKQAIDALARRWTRVPD